MQVPRSRENNQAIQTTPATMNPALRDFWKSPSRFRILYGGRASSKSWDAAANVIRIAQTVRVRVLCARQFQNKIEESVYTLLCMQIERFDLSDRFTILKNKITCTTTGSEFIFYGISRNLAEIKGLEGIDILWLEEAENIKKDDYGILEATMRVEGSEIWIIFNPRLRDDFIYQAFVVAPPARALVRKINFDENPFLSQTAQGDIAALKKLDVSEFEHRYLGVPRNDDDKSVIKRSWLESAIDAHKTLGIEPMGMRRIGFDIADDGGDLNATATVHGIVCLEIEEWRGGEDELLKSCTRCWNKAKEFDASIDYDSIGVGATAGAKFKELNTEHRMNIQYRKFNAGSKVLNPDKDYMPKVKNKDQFANLKAQAWWGVADRLRATHAAIKGEPFVAAEIISISSGIDALDGLLAELCTPNKDYDKAGRVMVESKKDLTKRQVKSPNRADAFIMAYAQLESSYTLAAMG